MTCAQLLHLGRGYKTFLFNTVAEMIICQRFDCVNFDLLTNPLHAYQNLKLLKLVPDSKLFTCYINTFRHDFKNRSYPLILNEQSVHHDLSIFYALM